MTERRYVRLYLEGGTERLPYRYDVVQSGNGSLAIPLEGGRTIEVEPGVEFYALPQGCKACGMFEACIFLAVVQENDEWIR